MTAAPTPAGQPALRPPGWDALLLAVLAFALLQITGLAEQAALPNRVQDVAHHPLLGKLLPTAGMTAMGDVGPRPGDPIGLVLVALTLGAVILYFVVDLALPERHAIRWKSLLLGAVLVTAVLLPTVKLVLLRAEHGPASYAHDGGVIQTEVTVRYLLEGKNPYVEDYVETPMAEWGFSRFRTALYHYPYLPWTFVFSAPFYMAGEVAGLYDQRLVYLLLLIVALLVAPRLAAGGRNKLALVMLLGLNPMMALDVIFGQNDVFVLCWLIFSLVAWQRWVEQRERGGGRWALAVSAICFGLACASKPTAWFFAPFYGLLLVNDLPAPGLTPGALWRRFIVIQRRAAPALAVFIVLLLPYLLWDAGALYDDVWRWSAGQGDTGYQIWGWGGSNFVLAAGLVADRFAQWPFWLTEIIVALPLLIWFVVRQVRANSLTQAAWHYGVLLLAFFYSSRFLNENYLGYILAFLAIGMLAARTPPVQSAPEPPAP